MPYLRIDRETYNLLKRHSQTGNLEPAPEDKNGNFTISLSEETIDRLKGYAFPGEPLPETIKRVLFQATHKLQ